MKLGMLWTGVALDSGEDSQGSRGRELAIGPMLVWTGVGRLKDSMGESWIFTVLASIFSWRRHLARRFWNQTWGDEHEEITIKYQIFMNWDIVKLGLQCV